MSTPKTKTITTAKPKTKTTPKPEVTTETTETTECPICITDVAADTTIMCTFCHQIACKTCYKKFFETADSPRCLHCHAEFDYEFLASHFTKSFVSTLKMKNREIYLQRELSLIPHTQPFAAITKIKKEYSNQIDMLNHTISILEEYKRAYHGMNSHIDAVLKPVHGYQNNTQWRLTRAQYIIDNPIPITQNMMPGFDPPVTSLYLPTIRTTLRNITQNWYTIPNSENTTTTSSSFHYKCNTQGCSGFINHTWHCSMCKNWTCKDCFAIKGTNKDAPHECKKEDVETATFIKKDTKPCPKCGEGISKINGCNQMWCPYCHTAFDWISGKTETKIHNPEYYRWMRENGKHIPREAGDGPVNMGDGPVNMFNQPCLNFQLQPYAHFVQALEFLKQCKCGKGKNCECRKTVDNLDEWHRKILHLNHVTIPKYNRNVNETNLKLQDIRIKYLLNVIDKEEMASQIQRIDNKEKKEKRIHDILQMVYTVMNETWFNHIKDIFALKQSCVSKMYCENLPIQSFNTKMDALLSFTNDALDKVCKAYNIVQKKLNNELDVVSCDDTTSKKKSKKDTTHEVIMIDA